jgi:pimeloyl-ACP methyl ester carboxylesterase
MRGTVLAAALGLAVLSPPANANPLADRLEALGASPCPDSELVCLTFAVPVDHRANDPDRTIEVTFGVHLATEDSAGVLLYSVGGPGGAGLALADDYLSAFDEDTVARLDIIFFDQRGMGPLTGLECPAAQAVFDTADLPADDSAIATAQTFVTDCLAELGDTGLLPYVTTDQAIRDAEMFRALLGVEKIWVYGESYGTQFAQQYATAFPQSVRGVILDGTVDLTLSLRGFYESYTTASEAILARVFAACDAMPDCAADMGGPAAAVYDRLVADLRAAPADLALPLGAGGTAARQLTAGMVEGNAFYALYGSDDRTVFLRALAAAGRGARLPMLRLSYSNFYIDSETGKGIPDPTWFGAAYYAVTCSDYDSGQGDPLADARAVIGQAQAWAPGKRLVRAYFAERLACALWPNRGPAERPAPYAGGDFPTLVLNADTDPITPAGQAYSVFDNARNASMILMQGGHHVIWGRGHACPDVIVDRMLTEGVLPDAPLQLCRQDFLEGYARLTLTDPAAADALAVAQGVATELDWYPELYNWDYAEDRALGCDHGGTITASAGETDTTYVFAACALWPGVVLDGSAIRRDAGDDDDRITLGLTVSGLHTGEIAYSRGTATEAETIAGTWNGAPLDTPRPMP